MNDERAINQSPDGQSAKTMAATAKHRLYLRCGCALLLDLSLIIACGVYCDRVPGSHPISFDIAWGVSRGFVNLVALWCAMGPLPFSQRVSWAMLLAGGDAIAIIMFTALDEYQNSIQIPAALTAVPLMLAAQLATVSACFLLLSRFLNLRADLVGGTHPRQAGSQFTIRHLLLWTTGVAILIGGSQAILVWLPLADWPDNGMGLSYFLVSLALFLVFNVISVLPIPWAVLGSGRPRGRLPIAAIIVSVVCSLQYLVYQFRDGADWTHLARQAVVSTTFLAINLFIVRSCGYQLVPNPH
jgi:hypothetical protein